MSTAGSTLSLPAGGGARGQRRGMGGSARAGSAATSAPASHPVGAKQQTLLQGTRIGSCTGVEAGRVFISSGKHSVLKTIHSLYPLYPFFKYDLPRQERRAGGTAEVGSTQAQRIHDPLVGGLQLQHNVRLPCPAQVHVQLCTRRATSAVGAGATARWRNPQQNLAGFPPTAAEAGESGGASAPMARCSAFQDGTLRTPRMDGRASPKLRRSK